MVFGISLKKTESNSDNSVDVDIIDIVSGQKWLDNYGPGVNDKEANVEEISDDSIFGHDRARLAQSLNQRHIQMLALVGVFGTGIFLSSGGVLALTGYVYNFSVRSN
jgi:amino acid transporter